MTNTTTFSNNRLSNFIDNMIKNRSLTLQQFQLDKTTFDRWLAQYHHHYINGLEVRGNCVDNMALRQVCQEKEIA